MCTDEQIATFPRSSRLSATTGIGVTDAAHFMVDRGLIGVTSASEMAPYNLLGS